MRILMVCVALLPVALGAAVPWKRALSQPAEWYATVEARTLADHVLAYQTDSGGWPKNTDMSVAPGPAFLALSESARAPTIDNGGTTTQLELLARIVTAQPVPRYRAAFERGLDYLLVSQYENGGWPQFYPLRKGYYTHITYNDNAMMNVLRLLREVEQGRAPFAFVDQARRARAQAAVERGVVCILRTQVTQDGKLTAWCAQHDEVTFAPVWARAFEPPSLSGMESVGLVRFLMGVEEPTPEIRAAIAGAVAWFEAVPIKGLRVENFKTTSGEAGRRAVADPAAPPIWARFYELGTNRPIFLGRDRVVRYDFNEIERERQVGYSYFTDSPASLLAKEYPRWLARHPPSP